MSEQVKRYTLMMRFGLLSSSSGEYVLYTDYAKLEAELAALRNSLRKQTDYAIALQRLIEFHCSGIYIPKEIYEECPHHANLIEKLKARQLTDDGTVNITIECAEWLSAVTGSDTGLGKFNLELTEAIRQWFAEVTR